MKLSCEDCPERNYFVQTAYLPVELVLNGAGQQVASEEPVINWSAKDSDPELRCFTCGSENVKETPA